MTTLRRLLAVSRPRFWLYLAGPVLVGAAFGAETPSDLLAPFVLATVAYFLVPANVFLYGINDVFDADVDRQNPRKAGRERRFDGDAAVVLATAVSAILGVALVWVAPVAAQPWLIGFLVLGTLYSAPPVRLKTKLLLDSLSNGLYVMPGVAAYVAVAGRLPPVAVIVAAWLWTMAMHTFSAIPDIEPDRAAGISTTATLLGPTRALGYCWLIWTAAAVTFASVDVRAGLLFAVYPALVLGIWFRNVLVERAYWWFPRVNGVIGATFTMGGLARFLYG